MKDIRFTISARRQKTEIKAWLLSLTIAFIINIASIEKYRTSYTEIWTQDFVVIVISFVIYLLTILLRLLYWFISAKIFCKK